MSKFNYGVVIGVYNGAHHLPKILSAISHQTKKPKEVIIWINKNLNNQVDVEGIEKKYPGIQIIQANKNYGVYARFTACNLLDTEYAMVFDDDTVPGNLWAENCLLTFDQVGSNSILGANGICVKNNNYFEQTRHGNDNDTKTITEVDLVGHCWVFKKELVKYLFDEIPQNKMNGEDIHFSASAQINQGIKTYVPAQPNSILDLHGSITPELGREPGRLSTGAPEMGNVVNHFNVRNQIVHYWLNKGWKLKYNEKL
jgi:hypothetical protein